MTWDKVVASSPVDEVARRVTSPSHVQVPENVTRAGICESDLPLPMWSEHEMRSTENRNPGWPKLLRKLVRQCEEFKGARRGRLVVQGLSRDKKHRWVARCDCGVYVVRTAKAMKNPKNTSDCCLTCRMGEYVARKRRWEAGLEP